MLRHLCTNTEETIVQITWRLWILRLYMRLDTFKKLIECVFTLHFIWFVVLQTKPFAFVGIQKQWLAIHLAGFQASFDRSSI